MTQFPIVIAMAKSKACLSPARFCDGIRCTKVFQCDDKYCKARFAEVDYIQAKLDELCTEARAFIKEMDDEVSKIS